MSVKAGTDEIQFLRAAREKMGARCKMSVIIDKTADRL